MAVELKVPEVGESITEVFIGDWLKSEGDSVSRDEALVEIETDKATLEVPSPVAGVLSKVLKQAGDSANVGEVIAHVDEGAAGQAESSSSTTSAEPQAAPQPAPQPAPQQPSSAAPQTGDADKVMPAAQRLLDANKLSASDVPASGPGGRLLKEDVQNYLGNAQPQTLPAAQPAVHAPEVDLTMDVARQDDVVPMSPLRRRIAERLVEAQQNAALLTTFNEIDMSNVMNLRKTYQEDFKARYEIKLGFMSFFVKAAIDALKLIPQINAEIRGTDIVYHNYYDIGVAVSMKKGLIVPVIRNAERLSFAEVEMAISDFGRRAQSNKISPEELQGGTFTISNGGVFGSLMSTPIVNPPQSAVLGMHSIQERPVAINGEVVIRPMMYVALTYDHRIVDGREAVTFLKRIKDAVEAPTRMLLEV
ncbi:MAG: 2-oxoglutarate dehydrogenase complex dihydrolipoyllysine-residue succinyltransferase [Deinococcota bacterium]